jgi:hypothetical protein
MTPRDLVLWIWITFKLNYSTILLLNPNSALIAKYNCLYKYRLVKVVVTKFVCRKFKSNGNSQHIQQTVKIKSVYELITVLNDAHESIGYIATELKLLLIVQTMHSGRRHAAAVSGNKNDVSSPKFSMASQFKFTIFTGNYCR